MKKNQYLSKKNIMHRISALLVFLFIFSLLLPFDILAQPSKEEAISIALLAAPKDQRAEATVLGLEDGKRVVWKEGTGDMICLADDPEEAGINIASYHKELEPFMARGRELKLQGKSYEEIMETRTKEIKSGEIPMPDKATLHVVTGSEYDEAANELKDEFKRWVIYIPNATAETTGLAKRPSVSGEPWIMFPGTPLAHIMITPPRN